MKFETKVIHHDEDRTKYYGARNIPIYFTGSFMFDDFKKAGLIFENKSSEYFYSSVSNPTVSVYEKIITQLEGGLCSRAVSSGGAAILASIICLASNGDHILVSKYLNGVVYELFEFIRNTFGIDVEYVDIDYPDKFDIRPNTKCIFVDSIGNPVGNIADIEALSKVAHEHDLPLLVDNTYTSPYLITPILYGADVVISSVSKYLSANGSVMGGVITSSGNFNWSKFYKSTSGDDAYLFMDHLSKYIIPNLGICMNPFNAFQLINSVETLSVRMKQQVVNAKIVAEFLNNHKLVKNVFYADSPNNRYYDLVKKYYSNGLPPVFGFTINGTKDDCEKIVNSLKLIRHQIGFGDVNSLIMHPNSETYRKIPEDWKDESYMYDNYLRLSVGIENPEDIMKELNDAFDLVSM